MPVFKRRTAAFTLVELLVAIAIIGILIALLMPAIQQVREAARKTQCSNYLRQIGVAYHGYENAQKAFPPAYISEQTKPVGWGIFILSYLEQKPLYARYNFNAPFFYSNPAFGIDNQQVANTPIESFRCPSAPRRDEYTYTFNYPGYPSLNWQAWPADYSPVASVSSSLNTYLSLGYSASRLAGALQPDKPMPIHLIADGTAHTILIAEMAGKNDLWQNGKNTGEKLSGFYGGQGGWADATSAASALFGSTDDGAVSPGPCGINCSNDYGLYSFHPSGANSLFADGSVRLLGEEIEIGVLSGLITRAGGEAESNP
jgi:prepilin-type N-terminal cleavage/methylation domain-containing protein/prepilin-type processing-associated H-X9-DG protein